MTRYKQPQGGPAFPSTDGNTFANAGMTLRQWYAGMAIMGKVDHQTGDVHPNHIKSAFAIADKMIAFEDAEIDKEQVEG